MRVGQSGFQFVMDEPLSEAHLLLRVPALSVPSNHTRLPVRKKITLVSAGKFKTSNSLEYQFLPGYCLPGFSSQHPSSPLLHC